MKDRHTVVDVRHQPGSWRSDSGDMTSCIALPPVAQRQKKKAKNIYDEFKVEEFCGYSLHTVNEKLLSHWLFWLNYLSVVF